MKKILTGILAVLLTVLLAAFLVIRLSQPAAMQSSADAETAPAETAVPSGTENTGPASTEEPATEPERAEDSPDAAVTTDVPPREQPFLVQITEDDPAIAYVLVRMPNPVGLLPLPVEGEYTRTLRQTMPDGSEAVNILHLTPEGFWMEEANCDGQDCVKQGEVTLANREERILWNMIICLPHQLSVELITREEAEAMLSY